MTRDELLDALNRLGELIPDKPTDEEIEFVLGRLDRIARFRPDKALKMQLYLEQGADGGTERSGP